METSAGAKFSKVKRLTHISLSSVNEYSNTGVYQGTKEGASVVSTVSLEKAVFANQQVSQQLRLEVCSQLLVDVHVAGFELDVVRSSEFYRVPNLSACNVDE